jgi:putative Mg2+ transporter-C (MgtC) family protein
MDNQFFFESIALSLLLGSLIGLERQWHRRLVDLKTNALVSLGSCLFLLLTETQHGLNDYVRMAGQVVVGVGFIGGGLLFREGSQTKGINTAATLWCCAAVGSMCGIGRWLEASIASVMIVVANTFLRQIAQYLNLRMGQSDSLTDTVKLSIKCNKVEAASINRHVLAHFSKQHREVKSMSNEPAGENSSLLSYTVLFEHGQFQTNKGEARFEDLSIAGVISISWQVI